MRRIAFAAAVLLSFSLFAQSRLELTVDTIMRGPGLAGYAPRDVRWSRDSQSVYFQWKQFSDPVEEDFDTYVVGRDGKGLRKLSKEEAEDAPRSSGSFTRDRKRVVFIDDGDVYLYDSAAKKRRALTKTVDAEANARFTRDEKRVAYRRGSNLFVLSLTDGSTLQVTNIAAASDKGPNVALFEEENKDKTAGQKWVAEEAKKLSDVLARRTAERKEDDAERKAEIALAPLKLKAGESVADLQLTPDEKYVIVFITTEATDAKRTIVPNYVTDSGHTTDIPARRKVGDAEPVSRVASVSTTDGKVNWLKHGLKKAAPPPKVEEAAKTESATGEKTVAATAEKTEVATAEKTAEATAEKTEVATAEKTEVATAEKTAEATAEKTEVATAEKTEVATAEKTAEATAAKTAEATAEKTDVAEAKEVDREVGIESLVWSDDGTAAVLPVRAADNKDSWLLAFDPVTATTRVLFHEHDDAWVQWFSGGSLGFVSNTKTLYFLSEKTGWMHLYSVGHAGGEARALTSGNWEVDQVSVSEDRKSFELIAGRDSLYEKHFYRLPLAGGALTKVTHQPGWHDTTVSPDGTVVADVYSYTNKPAELYVGSVRATTSPAPEFASYPWLDVPIVEVPARDGARVPARIYKPANWNGGPGVIFVHGAGYLQNVHHGWSNYFREYMFHHLLMERGYLVLDLDYRASAGYGRDWRTAIYRHMGGVDLNDHVDAAQWLAREQRVDPKRIGIYGGSYGGFITLMAMFTTPDVFAAGAALRPVTDWAHYNHPYTANILNTPTSDPEAYRKSSPIYFAEGLKGALLICHGMIDVNVHFQDSVRLAQRLIELRKENWELAAYPLEDHSFVEPTSWADEYKRILRLFESRLK